MVQRSVLDAHPQADLAVAVGWLPVLPAHDERAAQEAAHLVADPRVRHCYDGERRAGRAIATSLATNAAEGQIAWDMYLFYDRHARWHTAGAATSPCPLDWLHQLRSRAWADPRRSCWGAALASALREAADRLLLP